MGLPGIPPYDSLSEKERMFMMLEHMSKAAKYAASRQRSFDIVHFHMENMFLFSHVIGRPSLLTLHNSYGSFWENLGHEMKNGVAMAAISRSQREIFRKKSFRLKYVVHNGIDPARLTFAGKKKEYLLYLGNISAHKSPHIAIDIAKEVGIDLVLAGNVPDPEYFRRQIAPHVTHAAGGAGIGKVLARPGRPKIVFGGLVSEAEKRKLFAEAKAFIMPVREHEPFGLVMVEAMGSGTPVIAFNHGPAPEIVVHRKTGFLARTPGLMARYIDRLEIIDPAACRQHVLDNFTDAVMAERYLGVYREIIGG
jgi:glycosyltransferase involved in cell wall biosynthesis